jgi:hypothetical protein
MQYLPYLLLHPTEEMYTAHYGSVKVFAASSTVYVPQ